MTENLKPQKRQTLTVDLGPLKAEWQTWCAQNQTTPSEALRAVLQKLLVPKSTPTNTPTRAAEQVGERDEKRVRREISLTASENRLLEERAKREGYSVPKWLIALVRSHLTKQPQLGHEEQTALTESNRQLLAIARNLSHLAKSPNTSQSDPNPLTPEALSHLIEYLEHHVAWVSALIEANTERWKLDESTTLRRHP